MDFKKIKEQISWIRKQYSDLLEQKKNDTTPKSESSKTTDKK